LTIQSIIFLLLASMLYTYLYPWLYNRVNRITKRGEDIDEKIDLGNTVIMFITLNVIVLGIITGIGGVVLIRDKFIKKKK